MNSNAKKWVAALRSGEYKQGKGCLCDVKNRYCCLGVACRVYAEEVNGLIITETRDSINFDGHHKCLPEQVRMWLGLTHRYGEFGVSCLTHLNDKGDTFNEIADLIQSEPKGLFENLLDLYEK